jgi:hypothetical protein
VLSSAITDFFATSPPRQPTVLLRVWAVACSGWGGVIGAWLLTTGKVTVMVRPHSGVRRVLYWRWRGRPDRPQSVVISTRPWGTLYRIAFHEVADEALGEGQVGRRQSWGD